MSKQSKEKQELEGAIKKAEEVLAQLRAQYETAEAALQEMVRQELTKQMEDKRPSGIPAEGERLPQMRMFFLSENPQRARLEQDVVYYRGQVIDQERRLIRLRHMAETP